RSFAIRRDPSGPALQLSLVGDVGDTSTSQGALGILGVQLAASTTYHLDATVTVRLADPDGDGQLAFTRLDGQPGELAATGAPSGLATVSLAGGVSGSLTIAGTQNGAIANLPSVASVTVGVSSANIGTDPVVLSYDANALAPVQAFLTMGPRDLVEAVAQLATALRSAAMARDAALPFIGGNASDTVAFEEALLDFLKQHVTQPPSGPDANDPDKLADVGSPDFTSIQSLIDKLNATTNLPGGATISASDGQYDRSDPGKPKLRLTIRVHRAPTSAQPLDKVGAALTGSGAGVSYTDTTLVDTTKSFT